MQAALKFVGLVGVAVGVMACSSAPTRVITPRARATPAAVPNTGVAPQINAKLVAQGYRAVPYKGQYVYCRSESVTGTQFPRKVCLTEEAIRDVESKTQETVDSMTKQRAGPPCFKGVNC